MNKHLLPSFIFLLLFSFSSFAQTNKKLALGTVGSVLTDINNQHAKTSSVYALKLQTGDVMDINIENYYNENGNLSMNGKAQESPNSLFILKGNLSSLYGYLVLHDSKTAFEITTSDDLVSIEEIDIAKIYPDVYEKPMTPPVENNSLTRGNPVYSPMAQRQAVHIGKYNNEDVTKLQSRPGSEYVFYLNHSAVMNGTTPKNGRTKEEMFRVWQCTADQYSMFNLNVTTDPAVYAAAKANSVLKTGNIKFVDEDGRSNACVACFGTTAAGTLYRNPGNGDYGYGIGMTCAHEMGHQMGMSHDGGSAQTDPEYFFGLPAVEWCPIMGNYWKGGSWPNQLFTWSKGEYNTATQKQDDLKIMNVNENVPYMVDDIPTTKAIKFSNTGGISPLDNWGQIAQNTDADAFTFEVGPGGGTINLKIDPIEYLRQLDVAAKIVNSQGTAVSSSNLAKHRSAEFKNVALTAGSYSLVIQGGSELTPQTGFSNYSSLGYYAMEGTLTGAVTATGEILSGASISIFPNPSNGDFTFNGLKGENTIEVYDFVGKLIYEEKTSQTSIGVNLKEERQGIYVYKIINAATKEISAGKLIVQ